MKPGAFAYFAPSTIEEALTLLGELGDETKILAGGQSLIPMMNFRLARPECLVDLNGVADLSFIERRDRCVAIGAMTRQAALQRSQLLLAEWPLLADAVQWIGHQQIRNRGTIGGSVAHADPAAELPVVLSALDARFNICSRDNRRSLSYPDFFISSYVTALEPDEMVVEIEVPPLPTGCGAGFAEFARRHGDYALGGAAVVLATGASGICTHARIALVAAASVPVRAHVAEELLCGSVLDASSVAVAAEAAVEHLDPPADMHGSSHYRLKVLRAMTSRALTIAAMRCTEKIDGNIA